MQRVDPEPERLPRPLHTDPYRQPARFGRLVAAHSRGEAVAVLSRAGEGPCGDILAMYAVAPQQPAGGGGGWPPLALAHVKARTQRAPSPPEGAGATARASRRRRGQPQPQPRP